MGRHKKLKPVDRLLKCYLRKLREIGFRDDALMRMFIDDIPEPMERYRAKQRIREILKQLENVKRDSRYGGIPATYLLS